MLKKSAALLLFILMLCSCAVQDSIPISPDISPSSPIENTNPNILSDNFILPYNGADSLNPFKCISSYNYYLSALVYDSLVKLDNDFTPVMSAAADVSFEGTTVTVTLKDDLVFSDGSKLTARDVKYSMDTIMAGGSLFSGRLDNVISVAAQGDSAVVITLAGQDHLFVNLLDFPIVKYGTAQNDMPVGSGRYEYGYDDTGSLCLNASNSKDMGMATFKTIKLASIGADEAVAQSLKAGEISCAFSELSQVQGFSNIGSSPIQIPMMNLVYIGLNNSSGITSVTSFRKALSLALDRGAVTSQAFLSRGYAASSPFNPAMYATASIDVKSDADKDGARAILAALGYTETDEDGYLISGGSRLTVNLLVNTENTSKTSAAALIKNQLKDVGIECIITEQNFENFKSSVAAGSFDMFMGEVKLYANNDLSKLIYSGGRLTYGGSANTAVAASYSRLKSGSASYDEFCNVFYENSPFLPLCYRTGVVSFTRTMSNSTRASQSDIYFNIENWDYA